MRLLRAAVLAAAVLGTGFAAQAQTTAGIPIRIITSPAAATAEAYFALDLGNFKKYGLDAEVETLGKGMGSGVTAVVLGKAAEIGEADIIAVCAAREHGIPLTLLAPSSAYLATSAAIHVLVVAKSSTIRAAKDLNGKIVAAPSLEGPAKIAAEKWLDQNGADLSTIKFIELPAASVAAALANGTIGAGMLAEPSLTAAADTVRTLATAYQDSYGKVFQLSYWFATPEWVKANPDAAHRFAQAMHDTALWTNDPKNAERYNEILEKYTKYPDDVIKKMRRTTYGESINTALAQPLIDAGIKYKSLHTDCPAKDLVSPYGIVSK